MKSKLEIIEECIEEKTKEYNQIIAKLESSSALGLSSFIGASVIADFETKRTAEKIFQELNILHEKRTQLLSDNTEEELILGNREEISRYLSKLPGNGLYRLVRVRERKDNEKE